jgi:hypothetical protein
MNLTFPHSAVTLRLWRCLWAIGLAASVFAAAPARSATLLVERTENPAELAGIAAKRWTRSRPVTINPDVLQHLRSGNAAELTLETFDGDSYVVRLTRKFRLPSGGELWSGEAADQPGSDVHLVFSDHSVSLGANIIGKPPYALRPVGADQYRLCEIDLTQGEECCTLHRAPVTAGTVPGRGAKPQSLNAASESEFMLVDVVILYTPAARVAAGGKSAIENEAWMALNDANDVHDNSKTLVHLRLVALREISYTEKSTIQEDLSGTTNSTQAFGIELSRIREAYGADLVSVFVERTGGANGIAWTPEKEEHIGTGIFSIVKWDHAYSGLTFAHEIGHSFGAGHYDAETPLFPYSRGYLMTGGLYRTVMASDPTSFFIKRVKHYSNPDVEYVDPVGVPYLTGNRATADNARTIRQTKQRTRDTGKPTSFHARFVPQTSNPFTGPNFLPPGQGSEYYPSSHLEYLFGAIQPGPFGTTTTIPSVIRAVGFPADETAVIQLDPAQRFNEKLTISRPSLLVKRGTSGSVVIGPP